jgi:hypothetical protein
MGRDSSVERNTMVEDEGLLIQPSTGITWSIGYTHNLGNFQSLRLDVSVNDFTREGETVRDASERVYRFAEQELAKKIDEAKDTFDK